MNQLKALFSPTTRRGRAVRTALQGIVALSTFLVGILTIPGLQELLDTSGTVSIATFGVWIGVVSYIQNAAESLIKYLWEE